MNDSIARASLVAAAVVFAAPASADGFGGIGAGHLAPLTAPKDAGFANPASSAGVDSVGAGGGLPAMSASAAGALPALDGLAGIGGNTVSTSPRTKGAARRRP